MYNYEFDTTAIPLINEYYTLNSSFKLHEDSLIQNNYLHPFLQGHKVDLDNDNRDEIICLIGSVHAKPTLVIYTEEKDDYVKIFQKPLWLHNEYPRIKILESDQTNYKIFRTGEFHSRGSGYWLYMFYYLKKIGNEIKIVLASPYRSNEDLNIDQLNSTVYLRNDSLINDQTLQLKYEYESRLSYDFCKDLDIEFDFKNRVKIIDLENLIIDLEYDSINNKFQEKDNKIDALIFIENDTLQWEKFSNQIKQNSKNKNVVNYLKEKLE